MKNKHLRNPKQHQHSDRFKKNAKERFFPRESGQPRVELPTNGFHVNTFLAHLCKVT